MFETAIVLTPIHFIYIIGVITILGIMIAKKDTPLPCILFIFLIGVLATKTFYGGIQTVFNATLYSGIKFMDIITTIALITGLSKCLSDIGADKLIMAPALKIMKTPKLTFWLVGITMMIFSFFFWPSPAVALIGAIMLPIAIKTGVKPLAIASAMNLFGHGIALSCDFVIQGAPAISAASAGIATEDIIYTGLPIFLIMSIVTVIAAYFFNLKDMKISSRLNIQENSFEEKTSFTAKFMAIATPLSFLVDIILICLFKLKGGDATSIISGTAIILMCIGTIVKYKFDALEKITDYLKDGFVFGIKIFAPVIIIGAFFFIGGEGITAILGEQFKTGIMNDWALWLAQQAPLNKYVAAFVQLFIGGLTGLDGSGFSGLPLTGSLAATFGEIVGGSVPVFAALGQISAIWVGGGTIVPWGLIPVAAVCNVEPVELARRNIIPVMLGFAAAFLTACFLL